MPLMNFHAQNQSDLFLVEFPVKDPEEEKSRWLLLVLSHKQWKKPKLFVPEKSEFYFQNSRKVLSNHSLEHFAFE